MDETSVWHVHPETNTETGFTHFCIGMLLINQILLLVPTYIAVAPKPLSIM